MSYAYRLRKKNLTAIERRAGLTLDQAVNARIQAESIAKALVESGKQDKMLGFEADRITATDEVKELGKPSLFAKVKRFFFGV